MKYIITHASIRRDLPTEIAEKKSAWFGQIGDDYSCDLTDAHRTATAAAHEIADYYNGLCADDPRVADQQVRVVRVCTDVDGEQGFCYEEIIIRDGIH